MQFLKQQIIDVVRRTLSSEQGKQQLDDNLRDRFARPSTSLSFDPCDELSEHYPDLIKGGQADTSRTPIFVTARFRSGSTFIWNLFRLCESLHCYYEPLNERQWFNPQKRGEGTDDSHVGVKDYWSEYQQVSGLSEHFSEDWTYRDLWLEAHDHAPSLKAYISSLIEQAPKQPVLQFNRVDFRLPWLKANFPDAKILHLFRHPRNQWLSVKRNAGDVPLDCKVQSKDMNLFYTLQWADSLSGRFPFLSLALNRHPYYYHYLLWKLSYLCGKHYSDLSISYEHLAGDLVNQMNTICQAFDLAAPAEQAVQKLLAADSQKNWTEYATSEWFAEIENECDNILSLYLR